MTVRLKVDENLPGAVADVLNRRGFDAVTVADQGWQGLPDSELWRRIQPEGRWLVTADKEFADVRRYPPGSHAGIMLLRPPREGLEEYLQLVETVVQRVNLDEIAGAVIVVTDRGVRIRRAP